MRGRIGTGLVLRPRGGGGTESGRARRSLRACVGERGEGGGSGEESVTKSLISCAIHWTSSEMSSSTREVTEFLRTGSLSSGIDFMKRTEACWDLKVGARMRCDLIGDSSSSDVGGVEQGVFGLQVEASLLVSEGVGDCSRLLNRGEMGAAEGGGEGKSREIPRPENRRLISSKVTSEDVGDDAANRGGVAGRGGGDGVRTRGALDGGKKPSKVRPSTPVRTTLRESRLSCVGRAPSVALPR